MSQTGKKAPFTVIPIEVQDHIEPYQRRPLNCPLFSFGYIISGEALLEIEGKPYVMRPGQFILVPENKNFFIPHFKDCTGFAGSFSIDFLKDASHAVLRNSQPLVQSFWFDDAVFVGALLKRMHTAYEDKDKAFLQSALDLLLGQIRPSGHTAVVPEKFLQLVFSRDRIPLSVSEYAEELKVTANYLNKTVKAHTHRTAIDWIEIARLNLAKQLLKDSSVPIAEVAARIGLDDQSYFARFFKKKTGLTPSQFRAEE